MNNESDLNTSIPPHAVSLYGQSADAMDDFPVLKAFQQYIDAEQAKAQKRTFWLCIFFAIILTLVIGVFVILLLNVSQRNTSLNNQLIEYMIKDRHSLMATANTQNDTTMKTLTDSMATLQKQLSEQQMKMIEQQSKLFEQQAKAVEEKVKSAVAVQTPTISPEIQKQQEAQKLEAQKLKKALQKLRAEKEALAKEKQQLQAEKIDLHRRRMYPEYYENEDKQAPQKDDDQAINDELESLFNTQPVLQEDGTLRYFSDDEQKTEDITRPTSGWQIPLFD